MAVTRARRTRHSRGVIPLCATVIPAGSTSNSSATSARIAAEQVITASARLASHHSTECTWRESGADSQPAKRPASVAWNVATSGTSSASASATAGWATSQSWACTTSGRHAPSRVSPARSIACPMARVQATRSRANSRCGGSSATASTRTPSTTESSVGCVVASVPVGRRASTTTSCPAAASAVARACACLPSPPTTTGGYSQVSISTRIAAG